MDGILALAHCMTIAIVQMGLTHMLTHGFWWSHGMGPELPGILPRTHMYSECLGMVESPQIATREENHSPRDLIFPNSNSVLGNLS